MGCGRSTCKNDTPKTGAKGALGAERTASGSSVATTVPDESSFPESGNACSDNCLDRHEYSAMAAKGDPLVLVGRGDQCFRKAAQCVVMDCCGSALKEAKPKTGAKGVLGVDQEHTISRSSTALIPNEARNASSGNCVERHDYSAMTVSRYSSVQVGRGDQCLRKAAPLFCPFQSFAPGAPGADEPPFFWSAGDATQFHVRDSGYADTRQKVPSQFALYEVAGADAVRSTQKISGILGKLPAGSGLPAPPSPSAPAWDARWGVPRVLVVHAQMPHRSGTPWSHHPADDEGFSLVSYHVLSAEASHQLAAGQDTPALRLWRRFVEAGESTQELAFKAIGIVENLDALRVPSIIEKFNAKPALITKSARVLVHSLPEVLEIEFDVRQWAFLARQSLVSLRSLAAKAVIQVGYLIEGKSDVELPEQILAHIRLHYPVFAEAKFIQAAADL